MWLPSALLLLWVPGSLSLSGPSTVTGTEGGSLSVQCRYEKEYEAFSKYWCRQPCLPFFSEIVETSASGREVRRGRVSILDHPGSLTFTVTLENLIAKDAGKYRCGISTLLLEEGFSGFLPEPFSQVQVFVSPGGNPEEPLKYLPQAKGRKDAQWALPDEGPKLSPTFSKQFFLNRPLRTDKIICLAPTQKIFPSTMGPSLVLTQRILTDKLGPSLTPEWKTFMSTQGPFSSSLPATTGSNVSRLETPDSSQHPQSLLSSVHFLLLVFLKVPLLLSMLGAVLWVNRPLRGSENQ